MSFTRRQILGGLAGLVVVGVGAGGASRYWLGKMADAEAGHDYEPVSYTHLTLPTIYSV